MAKCKCGRSITGNCIGWHKLTEEQWTEQKETLITEQKNKKETKE